MSLECQYDFSHKERGFAVVIVNKNFGESGLQTRRGWKRDMTRMKTLFRNLQFRVKCYKDLKGLEMIQKVQKACSSEKNKDADCFACVISTHGSEEPEKQRHFRAGQTVYQHCVFGSDGIPVYLNDIVETVSEYRSPHLAGKPKLFFVQACRSRYDETQPKYDFGVVINGNKKRKLTNDKEDFHFDTADHSENGNAGVFKNVDDDSYTVNNEITDWEEMSEDEWNSEDPDSDTDTEPEDTESKTFDLEDPKASPDIHEPPAVPLDVVPISCPTDCLIMYPVTSGKIAFTNPVKGSYLLSYMYSKMPSLLEKGKLLPYLTEVVREVAKYDYCPKNKPEKMTVQEFHNRPMKTSACIVHRLTNDVVFVPKKNKPIVERLKEFIDDKISCMA